MTALDELKQYRAELEAKKASWQKLTASDKVKYDALKKTYTDSLKKTNPIDQIKWLWWTILDIWKQTLDYSMKNPVDPSKINFTLDKMPTIPTKIHKYWDNNKIRITLFNEIFNKWITDKTALYNKIDEIIQADLKGKIWSYMSPAYTEWNIKEYQQNLNNYIDTVLKERDKSLYLSPKDNVDFSNLVVTKNDFLAYQKELQDKKARWEKLTAEDQKKYNSMKQWYLNTQKWINKLKYKWLKY